MNKISALGKHQIPPGESKQIQLGSTHLQVIHEKEGWYLSICKPNENEESDNSEQQEPEKEFFQTGKSNSLIVVPALPLKPLVFKGSKLNVLPGKRLTLFLKIPLTFQVYYSNNQPENLLKEITIKKLSDTWFGEPDNGEPAFALGNQYDLDYEKIESTELDAICPITVFNNTTKMLPLQRLIIRNNCIVLYQNGDKITGSEVLLEYKGSDILSSADYRYNKIYNGEKQKILSPAQNASDKNLLKINFHFIKNIY